MAVAFAGPEYGAAAASLRVREPIVLTPTFPRFPCWRRQDSDSGDAFQQHWRGWHVHGETHRDWGVQLLASGEQQVSVAAGMEWDTSLLRRARNDAIGSVLFTVCGRK